MDYKVKNCIIKLNEQNSHYLKHRLLYGWIKSGYISQGEYLEIINTVFKLDVSKELI